LRWEVVQNIQLQSGLGSRCCNMVSLCQFYDPNYIQIIGSTFVNICLYCATTHDDCRIRPVCGCDMYIKLHCHYFTCHLQPRHTDCCCCFCSHDWYWLHYTCTQDWRREQLTEKRTFVWKETINLFNHCAMPFS
jgi:hypothetical protein